MARTMTSKERVLTALAHQEPDRVPINYAANPGLQKRLMEHFGLEAHDWPHLRAALGVDFQWVWAPYIGPRLHPEIPERRVDPEWGTHTRWVEHPAGGYWDFCDFPLCTASEEEVARWPMPSPDDYDYSQVLPQCRAHKDFCLYVGGPGLGDIINSTTMLRGMEQALVDLATNDPAGMLLIDRRLEIQLEVTRRTLEAGKGLVDFVWIGEDLGGQNGPLISADLFRRQIRPRLQRFVDLARSFNLPVMIHSCGSSSWAFPDFIEMGITAVDTLQPEAKDMAPEYLKAHFGQSLAFHGAISTGTPLTKASVQEVGAYCRHVLEVMMPGGGYCFAPAHQLQDDTPTENVLAMYQTALTYGRYR
ncbi:MAG: hypothetical protein ONB17_05005 [candidate division KSB1 bacterium]|nr:hypothetical protein [candidate division KSB1 bacterium]MDZ7386751.1 hypothetical protein [candidate division KSB1 bacterium]MDZ7391403.1 hypothetical protein [candidate division KSB1 bacterium]